MISQTLFSELENLHKYLRPFVLISPETSAIIERVTGKWYRTSADLPENLNLFGCEDLVDVSALGGVHTLNLSGCTGVKDVRAMG